MKRLFLLTLSAAFFASCGHNAKQSGNIVSYLTDDNLPPLQQIEFEKVDLPEDVSIASENFVYHDSILISQQDNRAFTHKIWFTNLNSGETIGKFLRSGRGPGEVLGCYPRLLQNRLICFDPGKKQLIVFDIDSVVAKGEAYNPKIMVVDADVNEFDILSDTSLVFQNCYHLAGCGNPANENIPELLVTDKDGKTGFKLPEGAYSVSNSSHKRVVTNIKKDRVVMVYGYKPQFTFLDTKFDTIKIIYGPDKLEKVKYRMISNNVLLPEAGQKRSYTNSVVTTENYLLVNVTRGKENSYPVPFEMDENQYVSALNQYNANPENHPEIFKFDWDGNLIARYKQSPGSYRVLALTGYSEDSNTLYALLVENGEWILHKAKL